MKNIAQLMQKAQQVQTQMNIVQNKLEKQEFVGESGNGAVHITMTGKGYPVKVAIEPSVVDKEDVETLEEACRILRPRLGIIPIHKEALTSYKSLDIAKEFPIIESSGQIGNVEIVLS